MAKSLFYEDVMVGTEIPPLAKRPTRVQLVRWAGASGDFTPLHWDNDYAKSKGLSGVIVHGALKSAWLLQMLGDWIGEAGTIRQYRCSHRGMDVPGDTLTCKGKVLKKYLGERVHCVECEVWLENSKGERTTEGTAVAALPSRDGAAV